MPPQGDIIINFEGGIEVLAMFNRDISETLIAIARAVTMQDNLNMMPRVVERTMTTRFRDLVRIYSPICLGSKVGKDPHSFLKGCIRC